MRQPGTMPLSIGRPVILLGLTFLVGTGLGWAATRPFAGTASPRIANVDYVAVVAQLFQRDHNEEIARERLALLGPPTALVEQALREANAGKVRDQSDRAALVALAQALAPTAAGATPAASTPSPGRPTVTAPDTAAVPSASTTGGHSSLLGPLVAFLLAFALGVVVLVRTAGLSLSSVGVRSGSSRDRAAERSARSRQPVATLRTGAPPVVSPRSVQAGRDEVAPLEDDEVSENDVPVRATGRSATLVQARTVARAARTVSFQSTYHLGDEPYDEIHPITDPSTGTLVAACGLSSALKLASSTPPRYYAFTAWVQDYLSDEQLRAVGLVSRGALEGESAHVDAWAQEGQLEQVLSVQAGSMTRLKTETLTTDIRVEEADFGKSGVAATYFSRLTVRFEVHWNADEDL